MSQDSVSQDLDRLSVNTIRGLCMDMIQRAESGHPGTPLGIAPAAYALWNRVLRYDPTDPIWPNRDGFVLSEGHASALLWSLLHLTEVRAVDADYEVGRDAAVSMDDIETFRQLGSHACLVVDGMDVVAEVHGILDRMTAFDEQVCEGDWRGHMGLLAVWYRNFFGAQTVGVMPYGQYLKRFPAYLQQLAMESNGKHVTLDGNAVEHETGAIYWGEPGTNGRHSFYQLIHQGTTLIPVDLICSARSLNPLDDHHALLSSNMFAQAKALAFGRTAEEVRAQGTPEHAVPHRVMDGNRPTEISPQLSSITEPNLDHDSSTNTLIHRYRHLKQSWSSGDTS